MQKIYNKLVRDKIPSIIKENGEKPIIKILSDEEFKKQLEIKLNEEYQEVLESSGMDRIEELADMLEVIKYLANIEDATLDDVIKKAQEKNLKKGSFERKIFLESVEDE